MKRAKMIMMTMLMLMVAQTCWSQAYDRHMVQQMADGRFDIRYTVLKEDTTMLDGAWQRIYRGKVIENGTYSRGEQTGKWTYMNYDNIVELEYDYTLGQPVYVQQHTGKEYNQDNYPSIYLGSPIVPWLFLMQNTYYPREAGMKKIQGKVVLTLKIDKRGEMTGYYVRESVNSMLTKVALRAADLMQKQGGWRWVPAMKNGENVDSEYDITLRFDIERPNLNGQNKKKSEKKTNK